MTKRSIGNGNNELSAISGKDTFDALKDDVSARTSCQFMDITCAHDSAPYLRINRSMITPNLFPGSTIRYFSGLFSSTPESVHQQSNNHAERCPIPPPIRTAFLGDTLAQTSLILALTDLGRICRSM